jgi:hypothetical protein
VIAWRRAEGTSPFTHIPNGDVLIAQKKNNQKKRKPCKKRRIRMI